MWTLWEALRTVDFLTGRLAAAEARIAALEAQVAVLAAALSDVESDECRACNAYLLARNSLTADAQHLAQLDAARREVCAAAEFVESTYTGTPTGNDARERLRAALDALAKLEGR